MAVERVHDPYKGPVKEHTRYKFEEMNVGDKLIIDVPFGKAPEDVAKRAHDAARNWRVRTGNSWWRFVVRHDFNKVYVWRIDDAMSSVVRTK